MSGNIQSFFFATDFLQSITVLKIEFWFSIKAEPSPNPQAIHNYAEGLKLGNNIEVGAKSFYEITATYGVYS